MSTTAFLLPSAAPLHDTGWGHPEHQGRLRALASAVGKDLLALHDRVEQIESSDATEEDLLLVHTPRHLARIREAAGSATEGDQLVEVDDRGKTFVSPASWDAAVGSAGAVIEAARAVLGGRHPNAFVAARPPGHHATPDRAMGFCLVNNVAVAVRRMREEGRVERVLIVDWDVHHGNGTQEIFYEDPSVFYLSLHQHPLWPGTGHPEERGAGAGDGTTLNVRLAPRTPRERYRELFRDSLRAVSGGFEPDLVLVSAGYDTLAGDPLGSQLLEPPDFHVLTRDLIEIAGARCEERVVVVLEGGYHPQRMGEAVVETIRALAGMEAKADGG